MAHGKQTARENHLGSPIAIDRRQQRGLRRTAPTSSAAQLTGRPVPARGLWISYRRFLDAQRELRRTCRISEQQSETWRGEERFLRAGIKDSPCNQTKQRELHDEARKRIRHAHAQCKDNQGVFGIIPGLNRRVPGIERLKNRTNEASQQSKRTERSRCPRWHDFEYSAPISPMR